MQDMAAGQDEVIAEQSGRAGLVRLNRPKALNSLSLPMIGALEAFLHKCAKNPDIYGVAIEGEGKAFCAGGDMRAIVGWGRDRHEDAAGFFAQEYQYNWTLESFRKPHVALIDGIVMGGGVGASIYGTHRVGGEGVRFAMPETGIGFIPDIGAGWFFPRMPGKAGLYLGLTGTMANRADAYYVGALTHCVAAEHFPEIKSALAEAEPIDPVLDRLHRHPGAGRLEKHREIIDRTFSGPTLASIFEALELEKRTDPEFAAATLETLLKRSPLSLRVTFEHLKRAQSYKSLREALVVEYRLALRFLKEHDLYEGVRAILIDKDQKPVWGEKSISEVSEDRVQAFFEPLESGELPLIDYWKLPG